MDVKLYNVCRACMSNQNDCIEEDVDFSKMSEKIIEMFTFCTSIQIVMNDGLPLSICQQCVESIQTCYNFINVCKSTDEALKHYFAQSKETELEDKTSKCKQEVINSTAVKEEPVYFNNEDANVDDDFYRSAEENNIQDEEDSDNEKILSIKLKLKGKHKTRHCSKKKQIEKHKKRKKDRGLNSKDKKHNADDDIIVNSSNSNVEKIVKKKTKDIVKDESNETVKDDSEKVMDEEVNTEDVSKKTDNVGSVNKYRYKKSYTCGTCGENIVGLTAFNRHKRDVHQEFKVYTCDVCNKTFEKHRSMVSHLKVHDRPYKCKICNDTFKRKDKLKLHIIMSHTTEKPFKCQLCPLSFKTKEYLKIHNFLHEDDKRYLCEYCGASFNSAQSGTLKIHIRTHTGEKPYQCKQCPKKFRTIHQLYKHERTHANQRTYKCSFCHKGFNHRSSMTVHERLHTGERPYKCEYCPRAFIDNWKRKGHLVSAHNIPRENIHCGTPGKKSKYYCDSKKDKMEEAPPVTKC